MEKAIFRTRDGGKTWHERAANLTPPRGTAHGGILFNGYPNRLAFARNGFGLLTEIDVRATLREKLNVEFPRYEILGACNPLLAHRALQAYPDVGLLLPCNVVVAERAEGGSRVSFMDPVAILGLVDNPTLAPIAADAAERLRRVAAALES